MNTETKIRCSYPAAKLKDKPEWIKKEITEETIDWCKSFAEYLVKKDNSDALSTSQLRKFFGALKQIKHSGYDEGKHSSLIQLKPLLAYAVGRDMKEIYNRNTRETINIPKSKIKELSEEITSAINMIEKGDKKQFNRFVQIVEAIVAYHKAEGGK